MDKAVVGVRIIGLPEINSDTIRTCKVCNLCHDTAADKLDEDKKSSISALSLFILAGCTLSSIKDLAPIARSTRDCENPC